jgi:hypothetical protein
MTTAALRKKIIELVGRETDNKKLAELYSALTPATNEVAEPGTPYGRILKAEADFDAGRYMSGEEARAKTKASLKKRRTTKRKAA